MGDRIKIGLAIVLVIAGLWGYYQFSDLAQVARLIDVDAGDGAVVRHPERRE